MLDASNLMPVADKIHNCDVMIREDVCRPSNLCDVHDKFSLEITTDEFIDVLIGKFKLLLPDLHSCMTP
jgi:hypothetical protein